MNYKSFDFLDSIGLKQALKILLDLIDHNNLSSLGLSYRGPTMQTINPHISLAAQHFV